jgi:ATP-dependent DNA helicase RecQ
MDSTIGILKKYWGFDSFRSGQEEIVEDVINGHDVLALLPTGGGKSVCFQVPGLIREGITIVISPLIALMQDQVNNLQSKGIMAKAITSGMSYRELDITLDNAKFNGYKFLYTSPERIQSKLFIERFKQMNVGLIVVDEAHCISEWGHDFRPSFMEIKKLREIHPHVPVIALTATATLKTKQEIIEKLELKHPQIHQSNFERPNLIYRSNLTNNKLQNVIDLCKKHTESTGIVYCQTRKSVKFVASALYANGISVGVYHGGLKKDERQKMLQTWLKGEVKVMVATNAFGMGIDKPNVRFVAHYEFPNSLEAYFQEAGRGGRDQKDALAINYWQREDVELLKNQLEQKYPPIDEIKHIYRALCNHLKVAIGSGEGEAYTFDLPHFCKSFKISPIICFNALNILESMGELAFSEGAFQPTKIKFSVGNTVLYNFQVQNESYYPITTLLTRFYPGIFNSFIELNEEEFCKRLNIGIKELNEQLKFMEKWGIIDLILKSDSPRITFLRPRMPYDYLEIKPEVYFHRKKIAGEKLDAVMHYLTSTDCRSKMLISYFGIDSGECGRCDNCIQKNEGLTPDEIQSKIIDLLKEEPRTNFELKDAFSDFKLVVSAIRYLMVNEIIRFDGEKYSLNK